MELTVNTRNITKTKPFWNNRWWRTKRRLCQIWMIWMDC